MGCLLSFKWILGFIGWRMGGGRGFVLGFLIGWLLDSLYRRPTIHFTFRHGAPRDADGYWYDDQTWQGNQDRQGGGQTWQGGQYRQGNGQTWQGGQYQQGGNQTWHPYVDVTLQEAYATLGIPSTATDEEVRQAYRQQALRYHPDRAAARGEAARQEAEQMFQKITQARDTIQRARGI